MAPPKYTLKDKNHCPTPSGKGQGPKHWTKYHRTAIQPTTEKWEQTTHAQQPSKPRSQYPTPQAEKNHPNVPRCFFCIKCTIFKASASRIQVTKTNRKLRALNHSTHTHHELPQEVFQLRKLRCSFMRLLGCPPPFTSVQRLRITNQP